MEYTVDFAHDHTNIIDATHDGLMGRDAIHDAFPELQDITDPELRSKVVDAWETAMIENGVEELSTIPWFPPGQREMGLEAEYLVDHIRDVTCCAIELTGVMQKRRDIPASMDTIIAGSLIHDISQVAEFNGMETTSVYDLLGHPYYGVYLAEVADLPHELSHIVLSHTTLTNVDPMTIEAQIIKLADEVALCGIKNQQ